MTTYIFQLIRYDAERPWIVLSDEHRTIDLPDNQDFAVWSAAEFPGDRFRVLLERETQAWPTADPPTI